MRLQLSARLRHRFTLNVARGYAVAGEEYASHESLQAIIEALQIMNAVGCSGLYLVVVERHLQLLNLSRERACLIHHRAIVRLHLLSLTFTSYDFLKRRNLFLEIVDAIECFSKSRDFVA